MESVLTTAKHVGGMLRFVESVEDATKRVGG